MSNKTLVCFILDRSGSMQTHQDQTISGFNEYLQQLQKDKLDEAVFSLTTFNTVVDPIILAEPVEKVDSLSTKTYVPEGSTALYDAVYRTIKKTDEWLKDNSQGHRVLCVIQTDGEENSSRNHNERDVADLIAEKTATGFWTFVFLGADQDAWIQAQKFGVPAGNTMSYASRDTARTFMKAAAATSNYRAGNASATPDFLDPDDAAKL